MTNYRDLICDPYGPRPNVIDRTAFGILNALTTNVGQNVNTADVDRAILAARGQLNWKPMARKALANLGYQIDIRPAREYTTWRLRGTSTEFERYRRRVMARFYSQAVSVGRMLTQQVTDQPNDLEAAVSLRAMQSFAVTLAADPGVGRTALDALADLDVLMPRVVTP